MKETYNITLITPMGSEKGVITLDRNGEKLSGILKLLGNNKSFTGKANGNQFEFSSEIRYLITRIAFTAKGYADGNILKATADSKYGTIEIIGKKA